ncbi:hypothetical protein RJ639_012180 [Escallonia herrerae]|uniref:Rhodanese domain-containing protein n=1 Tax=Escallonia herrerae TaxID=1293975 RepID=A0AA89APT9_9ASTE|nr:hypothetical protein RJ639_012180 [Escallonia herrerae]
MADSCSESELYGVVLYYKFTPIPDLDQLLSFYESNCHSLHLVGRVRLAPHGVSVTVGGKLSNVEKHIDAVKLISLFEGTDFKLASCHKPSNDRVAQECGFTSLSIRVVKHRSVLRNWLLLVLILFQIHLKFLMRGNICLQLNSNLFFRKKFLVYFISWNEIGKFHTPRVETLDPEIRQYSDLPSWIDKNSDKLRGNSILMYCTGGIRCEMASAYVRSKGAGFENVFQLFGGIQRYLEQFPDGGFFKGKNFVFDHRVSVGSSDGTFLGACVLCSSSYDDYSSRSRCTYCRMLVLVCDSCWVMTSLYVCELCQTSGKGVGSGRSYENGELQETLTCTDLEAVSTWDHSARSPHSLRRNGKLVFIDAPHELAFIYLSSQADPNPNHISVSPESNSAPSSKSCNKRFAWLIDPDFNGKGDDDWKVVDSPFYSLQYQQQTEGFHESLVYLKKFELWRIDSKLEKYTGFVFADLRDFLASALLLECRGNCVAKKHAYSTKGVSDVGQPTAATHPQLLKEGEITPGITSEEYISRRKRLLELLPEKSVAIIASAPVKMMTDVVPYTFRQDADYSYITGCQQPGGIAVLGHDFGLCMFMPEASPHEVTWQGQIAGVGAALNTFKADESYPMSRLRTILSEMIGNSTKLFHSVNTATPAYMDLEAFQKAANNNTVKDFSVYTHEARWIKSPAELQLMRDSASVGCQVLLLFYGQCCIRRHILMRIFYQLRLNTNAEVEVPKEWRLTLWLVVGLMVVLYIMPETTRNTVEPTIREWDGWVKVRKLHREDGSVVHFFPIHIKIFTSPIAELYDLILKTNKECVKLCKPGTSIRHIHNYSVDKLHRGLKEIGILKDDRPQSYHRLNPTSIGHYLGMDVHDCSSIGYDRTLKPGVVITIEPGVYIPSHFPCPERYQGIGIRIEDEVLITDSGYEVLTGSLPKEIKHIEFLLNNHSHGMEMDTHNIMKAASS